MRIDQYAIYIAIPVPVFFNMTIPGIVAATLIKGSMQLLRRRKQETILLALPFIYLRK